jgi:hypothetical protein
MPARRDDIKANMVLDPTDLKTLAAQNARLALARLPDPVTRAAVEQFVALAHAVGPYDHYKAFAPEARDLVKAVEASGGKTASRAFLRCVIAQGAAITLASRRFAELPPRVGGEHVLQLERIVADTNCEHEWLSLDHDLFQKEFGIATLRLYAVGAQLVDYRCGVPRSLVLRGGIGQALGKLGTMLRLGGFRPYFQIHTHTFMLDRFNEQGWDECYLCCAELYALHPDVLGMYGSSWFYDPALETVSPRLSYLRHIPASGGAHLLYVQTGGSAINLSLSSSPTRRKLYEKGEYVPKSYMLLWGKEDQMAWAARVAIAKTA